MFQAWPVRIEPDISKVETQLGLRNGQNERFQIGFSKGEPQPTRFQKRLKHSGMILNPALVCFKPRQLLVFKYSGKA